MSSEDKNLDEANAVRHIEGILVRGQTNECLLLAIRANERVHLGSFHIVSLLKSLLDLALVGLTVDNKHERVDVLNLLHGALRVQWEQESLAGVRALQVRSTLTRVSRVARKTERLRAVERGRSAHLAHTRLTRAALLDDLLRDVGLPRREVLLLCR